MSSSIPRFRVYGLYDPETDELRYIGQTVESLSRRLYHHLHSAKIKLGSKSNHLEWLRGLLSRGLQPIIRVLVNCQSEEEMNRTERELIQEYHRNGARLTNQACIPGVSLRPLSTFVGFIDPNGKPVVIVGLAQYCREHNLRRRSMADLRAGRKKSHRGYTYVNVVRNPAPCEKLWSGFIRPDGTREPPFLNLAEFCIKHGLSRSSMYRLSKGKAKCIRGWAHEGIE